LAQPHRRCPRLKVGIAWAGSPVHRNDRNRSIAIERFKPLFGVAGVRFFRCRRLRAPRALPGLARQP
jgi:hypothetical protein